MKKYIPYCLANSIYDIDCDFYKKIGVKYLFIDLDNTLDSPHTKKPSKRTIDLMSNLIKNGLIPVITSNNSKKRVYMYSKDLGVKFLHRTFKPFTFKLYKYIKRENISIESVIIIGDQIMTDVKCANKLGIKSILTKPLVNKDQVITLINRKIDVHFRKKIALKNLAKDWREIYAKL